jgi:hypothetical protein
VAQFALVVQVFVHEVAPQMNGVQFVVVAVGQLPAPSQLAAAVATPFAQLAARHEVVAGALAQAPPAAQAPVLPHGGAATQRESVVPAASAEQVPLVPPVLAAEHAVQAPVQAVLQQNPSTQLPEVHWLAAVHAVPFAAFAVQVVPEQKSPEMQSVSAAQLVLQAVAPHTSGVQLVVVAAGQLPAPSQLAAAVATPFAQLAARHEVVEGALAQAPPAAQAPVLPQGGAAAQRVSVVPAASAEQVPLVPPVLAAEHAVQAPAQAVLQQNPSTQLPDRQSVAAVQAVPLALQAAPPVQVTHPPALHRAPAAQSVFVEQVVVHAVAPQMNGVQLVVVAAGQLPAPSQLAAAVATPDAQLAARQDVVAGALAQAPPAAQVPVLPQGGAAAQRPSVVPAVTLAQVPLAPPVLAAEQAVQAPVQATLQQNPSTQLPVTHWLAAVQAVPVAFFAVHVVPEQKSPEMQSVSAAQLVLQAVALHTSGEQLVATALGQLPAPSQLAAAVATPFAQVAARHEVVDGALAQAPPAAQAPVLPQGGAATQRVSVAPAARAAQVPLAPPVFAAEQAVQAPAQAVSQQNPSTQLPDVHWLPAVHAAPFG